jgi:hypothetical protein
MSNNDSDPIGYVYAADLYCPNCIAPVLVSRPDFDGWALIPGVTMSTEDNLNEIAFAVGINRDDEHSFDSGDFPKVYVGTPHDGCSLDNGYEPGQCGDRCSGCGEHLGGECPNVAIDYDQLGKEINALDFDTVFRVEGADVITVHDVYAPSVFHDPITDVTIDGAGWHCLTGMTGQYSYNGAVMHNSEFIGAGIAEILATDDPGTLFAIVVVSVFPEDCEDHEDHAASGDCEPAGWAIAYKSPE